MKHAQHGFTHAENGNQEVYLRDRGWIGEDESFEVDSKDIDNDVIEQTQEVNQEVKKPRGRPRLQKGE